MRTNRTRIRRRKRTGFIRRSIFFIIVFAVIVIFGTYNGRGGKVSAHDSRPEISDSRRYYKSIEVKAGDTLWDIAGIYMDDSYHSVNEYVDELIEINQLSSVRIHEGCYLTIVYHL